jgi:aspartate/methionine/tyrosine aminotransferase
MVTPFTNQDWGNDMDIQRLLAERTRKIEASGIRKVFDLAASLKDPIDLSIGQPDFDVPGEVKTVAHQAIDAGFNRYTPSAGWPDVRNLVLDRFQAKHGVRPETGLLTAGASGALTLVLLALINPGDEILIPDPFFVSYKHLATMCGGVPVFYDTYPDWRIRVEELDGLVTPRTKAILAMSPGNPTGACIADEVKVRLAEFARRRGLILISDEVYEPFTYEGASQRSLAAWYPEGTLVVSGLSKTAAMTGWRLGWALGPGWLTEQMVKLQQFTFVCAPSFAQKTVAAALDLDFAPTLVSYQRKRDLLVQGLRSVGYRVEEPAGAFYAFLEVPRRYPNGQAFVEEALRRKLLCVPGHVFSCKDTHVRLSFAAPDERLAAGLEILKGMNG